MGWREKLQTSVGPGILAGITLADWKQLKQENEIDRPYRQRAASIGFNALVNSAAARREERLYADKIAREEIQPPLIILGHWRSGTTYLHHLLSVDPRFAYPTVYQTSYPHTFLTTEERSSRLMGGMLPKTRPMDNVKQSFAAPNEDEFALSVLCSKSPCMSWVFPRRADYFDRYLTFADASDAEIHEWKQALTYFLKKITLKYEKPLLLKSPPHTARVRLLLEMFPTARFVHIHRNPYAVFQSTRHTNEVLFRVTSLQTPPGDQDERILRRYREMHDRLFEQRKQIPAGRYHEVGYEELERDPMGEMRTLYDALDISDYKVVEGPLRNYVESVCEFRKNCFCEIPASTRAEIHRSWQRCFEEWGYAA